MDKKTIENKEESGSVGQLPAALDNNDTFRIDDGEEKEIDLLELSLKLWQERKRILIWCAVGAVLGLIIAFSIPREYTTEVKLAPELADASGKGNSTMTALAAMAGVGTGTNSADAVYPTLYPDIIQSVPFNLALLNIPVVTQEGDKPVQLSEYLEEDTKSPWWSVILGAPRALLAALKGEKEEESDKPGITLIHLTEDEEKDIEALNDRIQCEVDEKTMVVTLSVTMQDPLVSAVIADSVAHRLKEYVTKYRTNKSREDMVYLEKMAEEARQKYYAAQQRYAKYLDTHQGIVMYSAQTMRDRLENEAMLAFNVYNQSAQKLEVAKAKVQEETPVFATIEPAAVPLKPSAPRKVLILAAFIFLAFVAASAWILFGRPLRAELAAKAAASASTPDAKEERS